jgi:hypothetical protein
MLKTVRAVKFLFTGPIILVVLVIINAATYHGQWWAKWAALGIGIAWIISLMRVLRAAILLGGLAALVTYLRRK